MVNCVICHKKIINPAGRNQKTCDGKCREKNKVESNRKYEQNNKKLIETKNCKFCGKLFKARNRRQILCGNFDCKKKYHKKWSNENNQKPEVKARQKELRDRPEVKARINSDQKKWYQKNKKWKKEYAIWYYSIQENKLLRASTARKRKQKPKNKKRRNDERRQRRKTDENYRLICNIRKRSKTALNLYTKTGKIMSSKEYGIDYKKIIEHLKPTPNDIKKIIHHIIPLRSFNFINENGSTNIEEVKIAMAPENHKLLNIEEHKKINHFELIKKIKKFGGGSSYVKQFNYKT